MNIELDEPVKANGKTHDRLELREPTIGEVMRATKHIATLNPSPAAVSKFFMALIAETTGLPQSALDSLAMDYINSAKLYIDQFPIFPAEFWAAVDENGEVVPYPSFVNGDLAGREYVLELDEAISFGTETVKELSISIPTGAQNRAGEDELELGSNPLTVQKRMYAILKAVTGKEGKLLDKLTITKFREASEVLRYFLALSR